MGLKMKPGVKVAQILFFSLFCVFIYLVADGGMFTSYYGLMAFGAGGAVLAVYSMYRNSLLYGLLDLALIAGSFVWYIIRG